MQTELSRNSAQASLGQRLRAQRLVQQMSIEDVAAQLKLSTTIVEAMERDDFNALGAAVFARGRLNSYARLVDVPTSAIDAQFAHALSVRPALVTTVRSSRIERSLRRFARRGIYVVLTATIVLPVVWLATHGQLPQSATSLTALDSVPVATHGAVKALQRAVPATAGEARNEPPLAASIAPFGNYRWASPSNDDRNDDGTAAAPVTTTDVNPALIVPSAMLQLRFSGDSWVDVIGVDGRVIEHGTVEAGSVRNYQAAAVARVAIGNPGSVLVLSNGEPLDLKPFQNANGTRFTLSSDGKPAPVRD